MVVMEIGILKKKNGICSLINMRVIPAEMIAGVMLILFIS